MGPFGPIIFWCLKHLQNTFIWSKTFWVPFHYWFFDVDWGRTWSRSQSWYGFIHSKWGFSPVCPAIVHPKQTVRTRLMFFWWGSTTDSSPLSPDAGFSPEHGGVRQLWVVPHSLLGWIQELLTPTIGMEESPSLEEKDPIFSPSVYKQTHQLQAFLSKTTAFMGPFGHIMTQRDIYVSYHLQKIRSAECNSNLQNVRSKVTFYRM